MSGELFSLPRPQMPSGFEGEWHAISSAEVPCLNEKAASLALFLKYCALDHEFPNQDRFRERILRETTADPWWWMPL
jgi:hypothetical protein